MHHIPSKYPPLKVGIDILNNRLPIEKTYKAVQELQQNISSYWISLDPYVDDCVFNIFVAQQPEKSLVNM